MFVGWAVEMLGRVLHLDGVYVWLIYGYAGCTKMITGPDGVEEPESVCRRSGKVLYELRESRVYLGRV